MVDVPFWDTKSSHHMRLSPGRCCWRNSVLWNSLQQGPAPCRPGPSGPLSATQMTALSDVLAAGIWTAQHLPAADWCILYIYINGQWTAELAELFWSPETHQNWPSWKVTGAAWFLTKVCCASPSALIMIWCANCLAKFSTAEACFHHLHPTPSGVNPHLALKSSVCFWITCHSANSMESADKLRHVGMAPKMVSNDTGPKRKPQLVFPKTIQFPIQFFAEASQPHHTAELQHSSTTFINHLHQPPIHHQP